MPALTSYDKADASKLELSARATQWTPRSRDSAFGQPIDPETVGNAYPLLTYHLNRHQAFSKLLLYRYNLYILEIRR